MNEPMSHGDRGPLAASAGDQSRISPNKVTEPASIQNSPLIPSDQGNSLSLPFHVAITDSGLEINAKIKNETDVDKLIQILQTIKPLLGSIYGRQPSVFGDPSDSPDKGHARSFEPSTEANKEAGAGMSFFITKAQKAELRRLGYTDEQIREMKPEDAHRALGLIS